MSIVKRYMRQKRIVEETNPNFCTEHEDPSWIPPTDSEDDEFSPKKPNLQSFISRKRQFFTKGDEDLIHQYLDSYIQSDCKIIRTEFIKFLDEIPEMAAVVKKFWVTSLITKIRTERKKKF